MRKVTILIVLSLVSLSSFSCKRMTIRRIQEDITKSVQKRDNYIIPDSLYSYFPEYERPNKRKLEFECASSKAKPLKPEVGMMGFNVAHIIELYKCDDKGYFRDIISGYRNKALFEFSTDSDDYFIINNDAYVLLEYDDLLLAEKYSYYKDKPLVSDFSSLFDNESNFEYQTVSGLPPEYTIMILQSRNEFVLPERYYHDWEVLPDQIKHGYRNGIAFNPEDQTIIYWVMAW